MNYTGLKITATISFQENIDTSQRELEVVRFEIERLILKLLNKTGLSGVTNVDVLISAGSQGEMQNDKTQDS